MNKRVSSSAALERQLADVLMDQLGAVSWLQGWKVESANDELWDLTASGAIPGGGRASFCVEVKKHFTPSQFPAISQRPCTTARVKASSRALAMARVSPRLAELCRSAGWSWFDLAGNCRLEIPGVLLIERSGNANSIVEKPAGASLSSREAARVLRALLAPENAGRRWTQRSVVTHFSDLQSLVPAPSLALVNKVVRHLADQAFLATSAPGGFHVQDYEGLLNAWRAAYRFDRHVRREWFTLLRGSSLQEKLDAFDLQKQNRDRAVYAAFSAGEIQAPAVRQPRTWLYVDPFGENALMAAIEAKPVDSGENITVLVADDPGVFYLAERKGQRLPCTNAIQTYVDLSRAGGRGEEAAEAILQQRLRPAWAAALR